ncbi:MAG: AAA family ATPase, partial [Vulcanisaeta sp.]|nr:AAA family ATPase [Vulcanisaeta sp.]
MASQRITSLLDWIKESIPVNREFIDGFISAVADVPRLTVVYGGPGTGKTTTPVNMIRNNEVPRPVLVVAFNNSTAHWFRNKLRDEDCVAVRTIDSIAVSFVGFENMLMKDRDIERGIESLRRRVSSLFHVPYSTDPYKLEEGNELFGLFDYVANKSGRDGIDAAIRVLSKVLPRYGAVLNVYIKCLEGKVRLRDLEKGEVFDCKPRYDFTLARLELLNSVLPHVKVGREDCGVPRTLIVDEAQDLSPLMWGILSKWLSSGDVEHFIVAGDFDQLIYRSLHHADFEVPRWLYQQAKVRPGWRVVELTQSHRVAKPLDSLAITFLNAFDKDPSPWRRWEGNKEKFGVLYVKPLPLALLEIAKEIEQK